MSVEALVAYGSLILGPSFGFVLGAMMSRARGYRIGVAEERARLTPLIEEARDCIRTDSEEIDQLEQKIRELEDQLS